MLVIRMLIRYFFNLKRDSSYSFALLLVDNIYKHYCQIVDLATLTGACVVALGNNMAGEILRHFLLSKSQSVK